MAHERGQHRRDAQQVDGDAEQHIVRKKNRKVEPVMAGERRVHHHTQRLWLLGAATIPASLQSVKASEPGSPVCAPVGTDDLVWYVLQYQLPGEEAVQVTDNLMNVFVECCHEAFQSLIREFDFKAVETRRDQFGTDVTFQNATTAINLGFEPRERHVFVMLYRLIDGNLPRYKSLMESDNDFENRFDLDDLINLRAPSLNVEKSFGGSPTRSDLEQILTQYATVLRRYASDVLDGDFQVFAQLGKTKLERMRKYKGQEQ